jgi:hypothetical protein
MSIQQPENFRIPCVYGVEDRKYFRLDLDKKTRLEEVKKLAYEIGEKYHLGNCLIVLSSKCKQLMLDLKPLQNYNLVYGREVPFSYQQWVLKKLRDSCRLGDVRYVEFREMEKTSTLRLSPKSETKGSGTPVAYIKITGENEGIREYLKMLWVGRKVAKFLAELRQENEEQEEMKLLISLGVIKT